MTTNKVTVIKEDLLDATEEYICHQCNCCTTQSKFLAKQIFDRYPTANTYIHRTRDPNTRSTPGTIEVFDCADKYIVNMFSQFYPGKSKYNNDSLYKRKKWFKLCLDHIAQIPNIKKIAMPFRIGCGAAGGKWDEYFNLIKEFSKNNNIEVVLYKLG